MFSIDILNEVGYNRDGNVLFYKNFSLILEFPCYLSPISILPGLLLSICSVLITNLRLAI